MMLRNDSYMIAKMGVRMVTSRFYATPTTSARVRRTYAKRPCAKLLSAIEAEVGNEVETDLETDNLR